MATLIPNINPENIENTGERLFYQAAANLPAEYTDLENLEPRIQAIFYMSQLEPNKVVRLEADIVFLIGLKEWNYACAPVCS